MKRITLKEFEFLIARKPSPDTRGTYYVIDDKRVRWGPTYTDAADKNSETLRQAREALLQSAAALHVIAQSLEGADEPASAPEPEPGEWRNDRAPKRCEGDSLGKVWAWDSGCPKLDDVDVVSLWYTSCPSRNYWAPGNLPAPKSPPPSVVANQDVEPEKPKPFSVLSPEQIASMERTKANGGWITDKLPTEMDADGEDDVRVPNASGIPRHYACVPYYTVQLGAPWCSPDDTPAPWDPTCLDRNGWIRSRLPTVEDANDTGLVLLPMGNGGVNSTIAYTLIVPGQPWAPWGSNPGVFEK